MWVPKKKYFELEKRVADLEMQAQSQPQEGDTCELVRKPYEKRSHYESVTNPSGEALDAK